MRSFESRVHSQYIQLFTVVKPGRAYRRDASVMRPVDGGRGVPTACVRRTEGCFPSIQHCLLGERNLLRHEVASSARTESFTRGVGASDRSLVDRNNVDQGQERAASDPKRT